jgi:hypothetical protein
MFLRECAKVQHGKVEDLANSRTNDDETNDEVNLASDTDSMAGRFLSRARRSLTETWL